MTTVVERSGATDVQPHAGQHVGASARLDERAAVQRTLDRIEGRADVGPVVLVEQQAPNLLELATLPARRWFARLAHRRDGTT